MVIAGDLHELYEMDEDEDFSMFGWRYPYKEYEKQLNIGLHDHPENWYWLPVPITRVKLNSLAVCQDS
jgi:hypothetical protein